MQFCHRFCVLSWCVVCLLRGGTVLKKLFLDFSLDGVAVNPYMGCRWSKLHFCHSDWLDTSWQMLGGGGGGAIPAKLYTLLRGGRFKASCNSSACIIQS